MIRKILAADKQPKQKGYHNSVDTKKNKAVIFNKI
jgi:hypothetical protein